MRVRRSEEPRYVAVDGPPGSGASAIARRLAAATGATLYADPAPDNPFRDDFARAPERFAFQTQTFCLLTRYRQQVELAQPDLFSPGGAVADYVFARDELFARVTLRPEEMHLYQRIHQLLDARIPRPDLVVYVTAARDTLRARLRALGHSSDRVIKLSVFERLADLMDERFFSWDDGPLLIRDTTGAGPPSEFERLDRLTETIDVIRRIRAGVLCIKLG